MWTKRKYGCTSAEFLEINGNVLARVDAHFGGKDYSYQLLTVDGDNFHFAFNPGKNYKTELAAKKHTLKAVKKLLLSQLEALDEG